MYIQIYIYIYIYTYITNLRNLIITDGLLKQPYEGYYGTEGTRREGNEDDR